MNTQFLKLRHWIVYILWAGLFIPASFVGAQPKIFEWRLSTPSLGSCLTVNPLNPNTIYSAAIGGRLSRSTDRGNSWQWLNYIGITDVRQILVHPSDTLTIFCVGANGAAGLRRSTDGGSSWTTVLPNYEIDGESMTLDPSHPDTMYAGDENGPIYRSSNRGETWQQIGNLGAFMCSMIVRPDSSNILLAGSGNSRISRSTDYGDSWAAVRPVVSSKAYEVPKMVFDPNNPLTAYAATYGEKDSLVDVWKSTDGGISWFATPPTGWPNWSIVMAGSNHNSVYAGTFLAESLTAVFKSTNGGNSWTMLDRGLPEGYVWNLKEDPLDTNGLWAAVSIELIGEGGIYYYGSTTTGIRGAVIDSLTSDTLTNGFAQISNFNDKINLEGSGTFEFGKFPHDYHLQTIHTEVFPYYVRETPVTFLQDTLITQDIRLRKLSTAAITGRLRDANTHAPVRGSLTLFTTSRLGSTKTLVTTDDSGHYIIPDLYVSYAPMIRYDSIVIDPEFPYAHVTIKPIFLEASGSDFVTDLQFGDILIVGGSGSGDFESYYSKALSGYTSVYWNSSTLGIPPLSKAKLFRKNVVIYFSGIRHTPLSQPELDSLTACVEAGTNLLISGQDIVEKNDSSDFVRNILGVSYSGAGIAIAKGTPGEILDGLQFFIGSSDGAHNQTSWDALNILNPQARVLLRYGGFGQGGIAGIRLYNPSTKSKLVFFGSGFEAFAGDNIRSSVMARVIDYLTSTNIDIALSARHGWNLVSLGVSLDNNNKVGVYPSSNSEAYKYTTTYNIDPQIHLGLGYWLRFPNPQIVVTTGPPVDRETVAVHQGWNLIGSPSQPITFAGIEQIPPAIISPPLFAFENTYYPTSSTLPGRGVWVRAIADGQLVLAAPPTSIEAKSFESGLQNESSLTFEDSLERSGTLYFAGSAGDQAPPYDLPPLPPEGAFDVRFKGNRLFATTKDQTIHQILISSASFPLRISWNVKSTESGSSLQIDGDSHKLQGAGSLRLASEARTIVLAIYSPSRPITTSLSQNYPNPFNPSTEIRFTIRDEGTVTLRIIDILGREVAVLVNEEKQPGDYTVSWDATNFASGMYFYELKAGAFREVRKMLLIR